MAEEIKVQLFPPQPAGLGFQNVPLGRAGDTVAIPIPMYEYTHVSDVDADYTNHCISFTTRQGDRVESCLPWIVLRSYTADTDA